MIERTPEGPDAGADADGLKPPRTPTKCVVDTGGLATALFGDRRPYVVYWNNIPAPYMVDRFNALADRGSLEFEAWFNDRVQIQRSWKIDEATWRFAYKYLPTTHLFRHTQHWPLPLLGRRPDILVSLYAGPAFVAGWSLAKLRGVKTAFRVLRTYDDWVSRHRANEAMKRFLFRRVDAIETPGEQGRGYAVRYGAPPERVFIATHTLDFPSLQSGMTRGRAGRASLRAELGLRGTTFIYVGRLWQGKGLRYLLEAFKLVQRWSSEEVSLLLVGDGPEEDQLRRTCETQGLRNVVFTGFVERGDLPVYYSLADVFVFPTLGDPYGLVVDEAMACSLPVVSTNSVGEITDRIQDGVNGFIVPPKDSGALAKRMLLLSKDDGLRTRMGTISPGRIQDHTPENWARTFENIVRSIITTE